MSISAIPPLISHTPTQKHIMFTDSFEFDHQLHNNTVDGLRPISIHH